MKTDELREIYLSFFESKGCVRRPTDVLVPRDDPTVLFTPAGMNQFKNQFLGIGKLDFTRAATCQKCLRTGDISNVGVTAYHHTFFEMLGNFSFGDYFKREAINWAWEFLTDKKYLAIDKDRLTVTVYLDDDEAYDIWHKEVGLSTDRITREDEMENFWPAGAPTHGPDGVCGPCSEIYYHPASSKKSVEIWNLVFTQFNRVGDPPDNLRPLPKKNIDTGMGLERTAAVLQGVESNFEIDILKPLCQSVGEIVGVPYSFSSSNGRPLRRIADHVRAITFAMHEGVTPGSEKESYVIRQLLRRALLEGYLLGKHETFLHQIVPFVVQAMKVPYPELAKTAESVADTIREEEEQFLSVVDKGLHRFERFVETARSQGMSIISGDDAFDLHQTDGFLIELTESLAAKHNLSIDTKRFKFLMDQHKKGSGSGAFADSVMSEGPLDALRKTAGDTEFLGYDVTSSEATIVGIIANGQLIDELDEVGHLLPIGVVLNRTPFYGEAGGQVGDVGTLTTKNAEFNVLDTQRNGGLLVHLGHLTRGKLEIGAKMNAHVDDLRRGGIRRAHSATHLLHHALQMTLGEGAMQRGSKVEDDALRFDFAHKRGLTPEEIVAVEDEINARIAEGAGVSTALMSINDAKAAGATALFGEKYPDKVRVVTMGDFSKELCGGTHLSNTGQVGICRITSEEPVAKGVRRISALTGQKALARIREQEQLLKELTGLVKANQPEDLPKRITALQDELRHLKKDLEQQNSASVSSQIDDLVKQAEKIGETLLVKFNAGTVPRELLREYVDQIRSKAKSAAVIVGAVVDEKVALTAAISKDLQSKGFNASDCVKAAAKLVGGGGGGRPDLAEAGGRFADKIDEALAAGMEYFRGKFGG
ncbi:MAG: alanine--tRNA ligase [Planctomycetota bacterium]|nr:alanine--tRNA ligase [Planctomycetota bacterium]